MNYTEQQLETAKNCGILGYSYVRTAVLVDENNIQQVVDDLKDADTDISNAHAAGAIKAQYVIDQKLFELARTGDLKAIELYNEMRERNRMGGV
jgi:hypothetical protein